MSAPLRIHPTAIIDAGAELHETVEVGPYSIIGPGVTIGAGTWIGPHVVLRGPMTIGRDNKHFQFASLGENSDRKSTRLNSRHYCANRMPSSALKKKHTHKQYTNHHTKTI